MTSSAGTSAPVLEFLCLFSHDLKRKQKRWQDGRLKYHTFNKHVMVYDDRGNFIGDTHWRSDWDLDAGEEMQLERGGVIVQVSDCVGQQSQDLFELVDKRVLEREQRSREKEQRLAGTVSSRPSLPSIPTPRRDPTPRPQQLGASANPIRHRPLHALIGTPTGHHGRALVSFESPFEQRRSADDTATNDEESRPLKRRRRELTPPSKLGYAQSLFGTTLTLSGAPASSIRVPSQPLPRAAPPRAPPPQPSPDAEDGNTAPAVSPYCRDDAPGRSPLREVDERRMNSNVITTKLHSAKEPPVKDPVPPVTVFTPEMSRPAVARLAATPPNLPPRPVPAPAVSRPAVSRPAVSRPAVSRPAVPAPALAPPAVSPSPVAPPTVRLRAVAPPELRRPAVPLPTERRRTEKITKPSGPKQNPRSVSPTKDITDLTVSDDDDAMGMQGVAEHSPPVLPHVPRGSSFVTTSLEESINRLSNPKRKPRSVSNPKAVFELTASDDDDAMGVLGVAEDSPPSVPPHIPGAAKSPPVLLNKSGHHDIPFAQAQSPLLVLDSSIEVDRPPVQQDANVSAGLRTELTLPKSRKRRGLVSMAKPREAITEEPPLVKTTASVPSNRRRETTQRKSDTTPAGPSPALGTGVEAAKPSDTRAKSSRQEKEDQYQASGSGDGEDEVQEIRVEKEQDGLESNADEPIGKSRRKAKRSKVAGAAHSVDEPQCEPATKKRSKRAPAMRRVSAPKKRGDTNAEEPVTDEEASPARPARGQFVRLARKSVRSKEFVGYSLADIQPQEGKGGFSIGMPNQTRINDPGPRLAPTPVHADSDDCGTAVGNDTESAGFSGPGPEATALEARSSPPPLSQFIQPDAQRSQSPLETALEAYSALPSVADYFQPDSQPFLPSLADLIQADVQRPRSSSPLEELPPFRVEIPPYAQGGTKDQGYNILSVADARHRKASEGCGDDVEALPPARLPKETEVAREAPLGQRRGQEIVERTTSSVENDVQLAITTIPPTRLSEKTQVAREYPLAGSRGQEVAEKTSTTAVENDVQLAIAPQEPPRLVNPATRGRKAALKAHAAGQVPQPVLPPDMAGGPAHLAWNKQGLREQGISATTTTPAINDVPKITMTFQGFATAKSVAAFGPWSREANDLLDTGRPE